MRATPRSPFHRQGACCLLVAAVLALAPCAAFGSTEAAFQKSCAKHQPLDVISGPQLEQAQRTNPTRCLQLSGTIQGLLRTGDDTFVILKMVDGSTTEIKAAGEHQELQGGARVRCLVKPSSRGHFELLDTTWDQTPVDVLLRAAQAALKIPPKNAAEIARSAAQVQRAQQAAQPARASLPSRGADSLLTIRRAVARFNPKLSARELDAISNSIVHYCNKYGLVSLDDQLLVVAVIAAESHFNPNARSYKGAAGLGQLMPATAAAHKVDPYDPVQNLQTAIRIICANLNKYAGRREDQWNLALAGYNAGNGAVKRHGGVPPYRETHNYLWRIYGYWCELTGRTPVARPK